MSKKQLMTVFLIMLGFCVLGFITYIPELEKIPTDFEYMLYGEHPIYYLTAPFGMFMSEGDAVLFSGTSFETNEMYIVKYIDRNELKTVKLYAEKTSLIIDGKFTIEEYRVVEYRKYNGEILRWCSGDWRYPLMYKIHIPALPEINATLTTDWINIG